MSDTRTPLRTVWITAIGAWLLSRFVVVVGLRVAREVVERLGAPEPRALHLGLHGWDADWYSQIAIHGYDALDVQALRFFPLLPMLGRGVNWLTPASGAQGVVIVANIAALLLFVTLHRFVERETDDARVAATAVWVAALAPPAFVLVMGYAESLLMLAAVGALDGARRHRWWRTAAWAAVAGLARPTGVLLVVPIAIEALAARRARRRRANLRPGRRGDLAMVAAIGAAPATMAAYLAWAADRSGSFLEPLRIHNRENLRGGLRNPVAAMWDALGDLTSGDHLARGAHFVSGVVIIGLLVVLWRHRVVSLFAYGAVSVLVGLSAQNLDSLERYSLATIPLVVAAALGLRREGVARVAYVLFGAGMVAMSVLAFTEAGVVP